MSTPIAGLAPLTRYHFRLVAVNGGGSALGPDAVFTTIGDLASVDLSALASPVTFGSPVSVVGQLNGSSAGRGRLSSSRTPTPSPEASGRSGNLS